jgi:sigma-B regulation protein RsbU (phosphoserine phosphatase)
MSIAVLEPDTRRFRHVRAGHNPPLLYRATSRAWEFLKPRGLGLGLASSATFERILREQEVDLHLGDIIVLYSDGLTEMMDPVHAQFGEERLAQAVTANAHRGAQAIHDAVLASAREFQSGAEQHDDLTLLVLKAELSLT